MDRFATARVGHIVANGLPELKVETKSSINNGAWAYGQELEPKPEHAADPVGALLTERLRSLAADIRAGNASADLSRWKDPEPQFTATLDTKQVNVTKPFTYQDGQEHPEIFVGTTLCDLPLPLADFAVEAGVATEMKPANLADIDKEAAPGSVVVTA